MAYLPLTSFRLENASPQIPARLGAISRVTATYRIAYEGRIDYHVDASGKDKSLVNIITYLSLRFIIRSDGLSGC